MIRHVNAEQLDVGFSARGSLPFLDSLRLFSASDLYLQDYSCASCASFRKPLGQCPIPQASQQTQGVNRSAMTGYYPSSWYCITRCYEHGM